MKAFEKAFEPSILAARAVGPKTGMPTKGETFKSSPCNLIFCERTFAEMTFNPVDERLLRARNDEVNLLNPAQRSDQFSTNTVYLIFEGKLDQAREMGWREIHIDGLWLLSGSAISGAYEKAI